MTISKIEAVRLAQMCERHRGARMRSALFQLITTVPLFLGGLAYAMHLSRTHHWLALALTIPLGGLMVRLFIFQHDCGHGSYLPSQTWNDTVGRLLSLFTLTPYTVWRREHAQHHAGSANLAKRGGGEIELLTVEEYVGLSKWRKIRYRCIRNPLFLVILGGPIYFIVLNRIPWFRHMEAREAWSSIMGLNGAIAMVFGTLYLTLGLMPIVTVCLPVVLIASGIGVWLFYVQHQFENTAWYDKSSWNFSVAALQGSSYYVLPRILQWFTGNIGIHHVHHLCSMIPNYRLRECLADIEELQTLNRLTFSQSIRDAFLALWDEQKNRLVRFSEIS